MSYVGVNVEDYKTISKNLGKDKLKFGKSESIWNQSFQKIVKVRLSRVCGSGKKIPAEIRRYWLKQMVKFSNLRLGCDVWSSTNNCQTRDGSRISSNC